MFIRRMLGQEYVMNKKSGEVHKLSNVNKACGVYLMSDKNKLYLTSKRYAKIRNSVILNDGCIHCNKKYNTD